MPWVHIRLDFVCFVRPDAACLSLRGYPAYQFARVDGCCHYLPCETVHPVDGVVPPAADAIARRLADAARSTGCVPVALAVQSDAFADIGVALAVAETVVALAENEVSPDVVLAAGSGAAPGVLAAQAAAVLAAFDSIIAADQPAALAVDKQVERSAAEAAGKPAAADLAEPAAQAGAASLAAALVEPVIAAVGIAAVIVAAEFVAAEFVAADAADFAVAESVAAVAESVAVAEFAAVADAADFAVAVAVVAEPGAGAPQPLVADADALLPVVVAVDADVLPLPAAGDDVRPPVAGVAAPVLPVDAGVPLPVGAAFVQPRPDDGGCLRLSAPDAHAPYIAVVNKEG